MSLSFQAGKIELDRLESARKRDNDPVRRMLLKECDDALSKFRTEDLACLLPTLAHHVGALENSGFTDIGPPPA